MKLQNIRIEMIDPNPEQPRKQFNETSIKDLAKSLKSTGVVQPVVVRPNGERFMIIAGERRVRAAALAKLQTVPALIDDGSGDVRLMALAENSSREDLNPVDRAQAYKAALDGGLTQQKLADLIGVSRSSVAHAVRILALPPCVLSYVKDGDISEAAARELMRLDIFDRLATKQPHHWNNYTWMQLIASNITTTVKAVHDYAGVRMIIDSLFAAMEFLRQQADTDAPLDSDSLYNAWGATPTGQAESAWSGDVFDYPEGDERYHDVAPFCTGWDVVSHNEGMAPDFAKLTQPDAKALREALERYAHAVASRQRVTPITRVAAAF